MPDPRTRPASPVLAAALVLAIGLAVLLLAKRLSAPPASAPAAQSSSSALDAMAAQFMEMEAAANADLHAHFPVEVDSLPFREAMVEWWNHWNHAINPWPERALAVASITATPGPTGTSPRSPSLAPPLAWNSPQWTRQVHAWHAEGWQITRTRWHLEHWQPSPPPARAAVRFQILAQRQGASPARVTLSGLAWVDPARWSSTPLQPDSIGHVVVHQLEARVSHGAPAFSVEAELEIPVPPHSPFTDPLLVIDEPDGPALLMVGAATWFRRRHGQWLAEPLHGLPPERIWAAAVSDWNHDGSPDLWLASADGLRVLPGPTWTGPGILLWNSPSRLPHPQSLAIADIDADGDPDAFIGQYKLPYQGGQFPTPWHDAMDGFRSVLLQNNGTNGWSDITSTSGLGPKARRRIYSASFADWNRDGLPDLALASDFAGLDLFQNAGSARFTDITPSLGTNRLAFGMGHWTGDIDGDDLMDLLLVGMDSPVADRLDASGQRHPSWPNDAPLRRAMTSGNRWLRWDGQRFSPNPSGISMARGGWAWAATLLDADNDGWPDMHLANGHETLASTADYEEQFWTLDLHAAASTNNPVADAFFRANAGRRAAARASYGGWLHGALFLNQHGDGWRESAWLLGAAVLADQRNAVALDFDRDGRIDLAVSTMELWPTRRQRLVILSNRSQPARHWLGLRFLDDPGTGWSVRIKAGGRLQERSLNTGESHRSQAVGSVHFGLGDDAVLQGLDVRAPGSTTWRPVSPLPSVDAWSEIHLHTRPR